MVDGTMVWRNTILSYQESEIRVRLIVHMHVQVNLLVFFGRYFQCGLDVGQQLYYLACYRAVCEEFKLHVDRVQQRIVLGDGICSWHHVAKYSKEAISMIDKIVTLLSKILSNKAIVAVILGFCESLAKRTDTTVDDEIIASLKKNGLWVEKSSHSSVPSDDKPVEQSGEAD